MTNKQEKILETALDLFANEGYNAVSTSKIAKQAGVSEGLIFRHFKNKKGLLDALVKEAEVRISVLLEPLLSLSDPKEVIRLVINMPFEGISASEVQFWKLQFKLKWEAEYNKPEKMKPLLDKLTWAFQELGYAAPEQEAYLLSQMTDTLVVSRLRDGVELQESYKEFLLSKYGL